MSSIQNQAAWLVEAKKPLRVGPIDLPTPGDDDIVVKNHAIAINPVDWKIQDYGFYVAQWPFVLGTDVSGEVHEVGKNVTKFKKGDRVLGHAISLASQKAQDGGFQLYTNLLSHLAAKIPEQLSHTAATVLPLAIDTAATGLYDTKDGAFGLPYPSLNPTPTGKTILVWGGSSSVGAVTIQLAVASGVKVVAVASSRNHELVKQLGASDAIDYNDGNVIEDTVKAIQTVGGDFIGVYDAISTSDSYKFVLPIAEKLKGGTIATVLDPPKDGVPADIKFGHIFAINSVSHPVWAEYVTPALEQGKLKAVPEPLVVGEGLESVQKGMDTNKAGVSARKVVAQL